MEIAIVVVLAVAAFWIFKTVKGGASAAENALVNTCRGDKALANRLIDLELKKDASLSRKEAATRARSKYLRDRGG